MFLQLVRQPVGDVDQPPLLAGTPSLSKNPVHLARRLGNRLSALSRGEMRGNAMALSSKGNSLLRRTLSFKPFLSPFFSKRGERSDYQAQILFADFVFFLLACFYSFSLSLSFFFKEVVSIYCFQL